MPVLIPKNWLTTLRMYSPVMELANWAMLETMAVEVVSAQEVWHNVPPAIVIISSPFL
jgi:hypothetical protein